jgi:hypothetical protein
MSRGPRRGWRGGSVTSDDLTLFPDDDYRRRNTPSSASEATPKIFIATPLTGLTPNGRASVRSASELACQVVLNASDDQEDPWCIAIHSPLDWSDPSGPAQHTAAEVFDLNETEVLARADALIAIGHDGGSVGVGMEINWAMMASIPLLYLEPHAGAASRQILGTTHFAEVTIIDLVDTEVARGGIAAWLERHRVQISDGPRRRRNAEITWAARRDRLKEAWDDLSPPRRNEVSALAGIARAKIERVLAGQPLVLAHLPARSYSMLEQALATTTLPEIQLPELSARERATLASAAQEAGWGVPQVLAYEQAARRELAKGGIRRLTFSSTQDWFRLADRQ